MIGLISRSPTGFLVSASSRALSFVVFAHVHRIGASRDASRLLRAWTASSNRLRHHGRTPRVRPSETGGPTTTLNTPDSAGSFAHVHTRLHETPRSPIPGRVGASPRCCSVTAHVVRFHRRVRGRHLAAPATDRLAGFPTTVRSRAHMSIHVAPAVAPRPVAPGSWWRLADLATSPVARVLCTVAEHVRTCSRHGAKIRVRSDAAHCRSTRVRIAHEPPVGRLPRRAHAKRASLSLAAALVGVVLVGSGGQ